MRRGVRGDRVVKVLAGVVGLGIVLFLVDRPRRGAGRPIASHSATAPATQPLVLPVLGAAEPLGPDAAGAVERSIRGAVRFLYSVQTDAAWDVAGDDGETTALVLHALLSVGERADDPRLARAIERAAAAPVGNTKALARRLRVLTDLPPREDRVRLGWAWADQLLAATLPQGPRAEFFTHGPGDLRYFVDDQFVALDALVMARERFGADLPASHLVRIGEGWRMILDESGGAALLFEDDPRQWLGRVQTTSRGVWALRATAAAAAESARVAGPAMAVLTKRYASLYVQPRPCEAIHSFARAMLAEQLRWIGGRDWYKDTVVFLLRHQRGDGAWAPADGADRRAEIVETCHALLVYACGQLLPQRETVPFDRFDDGEFWATVAREPVNPPTAGAVDAQIALMFPPPATPRPQANPAGASQAAVATAAAPAAPRREVGLAAVVAPAATTEIGPARFDDVRSLLARQNVRLAVDSVSLGNWTLQRYDVAWMTGRQVFGLSRLQRMELRRFLDVGGTLLVETADNDRDAVQRQMARLFPEQTLTFEERYPNDSPAEAAQSVREARLDGRSAILLTVRPTQSDMLLNAALAARSR